MIHNLKRTTLQSLIMLFALAFIFASCTKRYVAEPYNISPDRMPELSVGATISYHQ